MLAIVSTYWACFFQRVLSLTHFRDKRPPPTYMYIRTYIPQGVGLLCVLCFYDCYDWFRAGHVIWTWPPKTLSQDFEFCYLAVEILSPLHSFMLEWFKVDTPRGDGCPFIIPIPSPSSFSYFSLIAYLKQINIGVSLMLFRWHICILFHKKENKKQKRNVSERLPQIPINENLYR